MTVSELIDELRRRYLSIADKDRAPGMAAYMKNHFPFLGVSSIPRKEVLKEWMPLTKNVDFWDLVYALWNEKEREFHYAALVLMQKLKAAAIERDCKLYIEELITTNSWWDSVDVIAPDFMGRYLLKFPEERNELIAKFRDSGNLWLQRSTLIFQLKYRDKTDFELLQSLIHCYQNDKEFFIQKAIGWSLRQYSKTNPEAVRQFVQENELKTVAKREAVKYI